MGVFFLATRGAGKSRAVGRKIAWADFMKWVDGGVGVPLAIIDPLGPTIDNFLDKILRVRDPQTQAELWKRVRYVNMAGEMVGTTRYVIPMPIYYRAQEGESAYSVASRYIDVVRRMDPNLAQASIQGMNRLAPLARSIGMLLWGLGLGIDQAESMLSHPSVWLPRVEPLGRVPELLPALEYYRIFAGLDVREAPNWAGPLRNQISVLRQNQVMRAIFGGTQQFISWPEVADQRLCVLIDLRDVLDTESRRFMLLWVFFTLIDYVRRRKQHKGQRPFSIIVDEFSYMVGAGTLNSEALRSDLEELINQLARNRDVWLSVCSQEAYQIPELMLKGLLAMGTQIYGSTFDLDSAIQVGRRFFRYDHTLVKKIKPGTFPGSMAQRFYNLYHYGTDSLNETEEFSMDEQAYYNALRFLDLSPNHFLVGTAPREGQLPTKLTHVALEQSGRDPDKGVYFVPYWCEQARRQLMARDGIPVERLLHQLDQQSVPMPASEPVRTTRPKKAASPLSQDTTTPIMPPTPNNVRKSRKSPAADSRTTNPLED